MTCALQGPEELFETTAQCLISGMDRDALSGWGAVIYVV
jgi:20S proteasome subunit beta 3